MIRIYLTNKDIEGYHEILMTTKTYRFWINSSRRFHREEVKEIENETHSEDEIHDNYLLPWYESVFPMFHFTDSFVKYGFEEVNDVNTS